MSTRCSRIGLSCLILLLAVTPAWTESKDDEEKKQKISATKVVTRIQERIKEGKADEVARLLSYDEVLEAVEKAPVSARDIAHVICDRARDIGVQGRGNKPVTRSLAAGLEKLAERTLRAHPKSPVAESAMSSAMGAMGRIYEALGSPQPFSTWEQAATHATKAADLEPEKRAEHLLQATRFLREGARAANQREQSVLRQALAYITDARQGRADDGALRRENAFVHLAIAAFGVRQEQEDRAREAYNNALVLVEKDAQTSPEDKGAYNRVVAFGLQNGLVRAEEDFVGVSSGEHSPWWELKYPEGSGWTFDTAIDMQAVIRMTKTKDSGARMTIVIRRYKARVKYGASNTSGEKVGGIMKLLAEFWRPEFKLSEELTVRKDQLPAFLAKAKSWGVIGDMRGERSRMQAFFFRGKESACTWALEILEHGAWPARMDPEVVYILKTLTELPQKKK